MSVNSHNNCLFHIVTCIFISDYLLLIYGPFNFGHNRSHLAMKNCFCWIFTGLLHLRTMLRQITLGISLIF